MTSVSEKVTIADLARELGLSKSAVSNALNGVRGVSDETRERVKAFAEEKGWRPNALARALSRGKALAIGVCLARHPDLLANEPFYQMVLAGMESVLVDTEYSLLLRMVGDQPGRDLAVYEDWAREARVDGVVLFDLRDADPRLPLLKQLGIPTLLAGKADSDLPQVFDEEAPEADDVVAHLAGLGHHHVLHLTGPEHLLHVTNRIAQVARACAERGLQITRRATDYTFESACAEFSDALEEGGFTAVVCDSDILASAAAVTASDRGIAVPSTLSIVAWDDSLLCRLAMPPITALERLPMELGRRCATLLLAMLEGDSVPQRNVIPCVLRVRDSTGPAAR